VVALVVGVSGTALGAHLITSADVKDNSLQSVDIKNGTLQAEDMANGAVTNPKLNDNSVDSSKIKNGSVGLDDLSSSAKSSLKTTYAGPNWSIVDRNVVGNGDSYLRAGPSFSVGGVTSNPPLGIGSLGMRTGSSTDKATFGDQVDYAGVDFSTITKVEYWAFTTGENITAGGSSVNLPNIQFELNPNLNATPSSFTTASFDPAAGSNNPGWNDIDAVTSGTWFLTGAAGTATGCTQASECTFAQLQTALNDGGNPATIFTVQFSKGQDFAYSGAVDDLTINNTTYDFEPFGVTATTQ
jgi:hypothetical protein